MTNNRLLPLFSGVIAVIVGIWVTTLVAPGVDNAVVITIVAFFVTYRLLFTATAVSVAKQVHENQRRRSLYPQDEYFDPEQDPIVRRHLALMGYVFFANLALMLASPAVLWLVIRVAQALGVEVSTAGYWRIAVAVLVTVFVGGVVKLLLLTVFLGSIATTLTVLAPIVLCTAALLVADWLLDDVALAEGPLWQQLLTLAVLGALFTKVTVTVTASGVASVLLIVTNSLLLWLLSWVSTALALPLSVSGFFAFVITGVIVTLAMWPVRQPADSAIHNPHDPFAANLPMGPQY